MSVRAPAVLRAGVLVGCLGLSARPALAFDPGAFRDRLEYRDAVLAAHPSIDAAAWALIAASARREAATAWPDPMLGVGVAPAMLVDDGMLGVEVQLKVPFPTPGGQRARRAAGDAGIDMASADRQMARVELAAMAMSTWEQRLLVEEALLVNSKHSLLLQQLEDVARGRYAVGLGSAAAPLMAASERAMVDMERAMLQADRAMYDAELDHMLQGQGGREAQAQLPDESPLPAGVHPVLGGGDAEGDTEKTELAMTRADRWPMLGLMGTWSNMAADPMARFMVGVELSLPVQIGARRSLVAAATADLQAADARQRTAEHAVMADVLRAEADLRRARTVFDIQQSRLVPLASASLESMRAGAAAGMDDPDALIAAERQLREAQLGLVRAATAVALAEISLDMARGRIALSSSSPAD
jgi:outer membrane protein, heavy metal efflux system